MNENTVKAMNDAGADDRPNRRQDSRKRRRDGCETSVLP